MEPQTVSNRPDFYKSDFIKSYVCTALWSSTDDSDQPLDDNYDHTDLSDECLARIVEDCEDFIKANAELLERAYAMSGYSPARAGHDFWLTRNGHGAGFWDRGLGWVGYRLTDAAKVYRGCDLYVGDPDDRGVIQIHCQ